MSRDPSLLPEELRPSEDHASASSGDAAPIAFHIPASPTPPAPAQPPLPAPAPPFPTPAPPPIAERAAVSSPAPLPRRNGNGQRQRLPGNGHRHEPPRASRRQQGQFSVPDAPSAVRGVTLLPDARGAGAARSGWELRVMVWGVLLAGCVVAGVAVAVDRRVASLDAAVRAADRAVRATAGASEMDRALDAAAGTARRARAARDLLARHRVWGPFWALLEQRTLPDVAYQSATADAGGSVLLAVSAPSVRAAAEQIVAWRDVPGIARAEATALTTTLDALGVVRGVRFDLRLTVDSSVFSVRPNTTAVQ